MIARCDCRIQSILSVHDLPKALTLEALARFLHESLKPYEDDLDDVRRALSRALDNTDIAKGFVLLATENDEPTGVAVVHHTPWSGYVPAHLLLYLAVSPPHRGRGLGRRLLEAAVERCDGDIKLHVEHDNPAKRLYERAGFTSQYAEMRYTRS